MRIEPPEAEEFAFIFDSWANSFRNSPYAGCVRNCDYPATSRAAMSEIVDRGARVAVLVTETDKGVRRIIGYSVSEPERKVLHYIYVKRDFRNCGMGRVLRRDAVADPAGWVYTYRTNASARFLHQMEHDPAPARTKE